MPGLSAMSALGATETISVRRQDTARAAYAFGERADQIGDGGNRSGCCFAVSAEIVAHGVDQRRADDDAVGAFGDGARLLGGAHAETDADRKFRLPFDALDGF